MSDNTTLIDRLRAQAQHWRMDASHDDDCEHCALLDEAASALQQQAQGTVPPREPTKEMIAAARRAAQEHGGRSFEEFFVREWHAAYDAAPQAAPTLPPEIAAWRVDYGRPCAGDIEFLTWRDLELGEKMEHRIAKLETQGHRCTPLYESAALALPDTEVEQREDAERAKAEQAWRISEPLPADIADVFDFKRLDGTLRPAAAARVAALLRDARRYRFLRDWPNNGDSDLIVCANRPGPDPSVDQLDAEIDAVIDAVLEQQPATGEGVSATAGQANDSPTPEGEA